MPKDQQTHGAPRQRPVSCRFCRSRKLRCSREAPCSNCVSRSLRCELEYPIVSSPVSLGSSESELIERIRKLEELVEIQRSHQPESLEQHPQSPATVPQRKGGSTLSPQLERLDNDVAWLESIYCAHTRTLSEKIPFNKAVFRTCSIEHVMEAQSYIIVPHKSDHPTRCIWLPQYAEARILLEKYIQDIDHSHHVVNTPLLPSILDEVYTSVSQQRSVKPGKMMLLLSIFASCTHSWECRDCHRGLFTTSPEANRQSPLWIKAFEDVLDIAQPTAGISIEGIQGIIITFFVSGNVEGFSQRSRLLINTAIHLARELGLHYIDHPNNASSAHTVEAEIGRRVWWYLVACDWAFAGRYSGIALGVYQCHMRQMAVKKPLNINDEDLVDGMSRIDKPLSEPTVMSYPLMKIRLAEISRSIVDRTPLLMAQAYIPSHDVVMDIDTQMELLLNDVPPYFSMSKADISENYRCNPSSAAKIFHQGYMFHSTFYAQRCKLHFHYFARGYVDSRYAASRDSCVQAARLIVRTELRMEESGIYLPARYEFVVLLLGMFMATLILIMDLCHNKALSQEGRQPHDIANALRLLEEARHGSETTTKFLDSLMLILQKHKVTPPKHDGQRSEAGGEHLPTASDGPATFNPAISQPYGEPAIASIPMTPLSGLGPDEVDSFNIVGDRPTNGDDLSSYFNGLAQSFDPGDFDWNNIFSELDFLV